MTECWIWAGATDRNGYPHRKYGNKTYMIHRVVYESEVGLIPSGLTLDHLCRVTTCINPGHMEVVTLKQNILRGDSPSAKHARQTHCIHGHEFNKENTQWNNNKRKCKTCSRRLFNAWYARKKVAI